MGVPFESSRADGQLMRAQAQPFIQPPKPEKPAENRENLALL
jgi:hypothetical protein